jgi:osmotically-inducible protein OsmY
MNFKSNFKIMLMVFAFVLAGNLGVYAQKTDCSQKTDNEIVIAIYEKVKVKYADQIKHVNIRIDAGTVTIEGWVNNKKAKKEIEKIAKKSDCVKKVINNLTVGKAGGCGPGTKECGGICIPEKESCNICLADSTLKGCFTEN